MDDLAALFTYLLECSKVGLQNVQLKRLNEAANLEKEMRMLLDSWVNARAGALLAELLRAHGEELTGNRSELSIPTSQERADSLDHAEADRLASLQPRNRRHGNRNPGDLEDVA